MFPSANASYTAVKTRPAPSSSSSSPPPFLLFILILSFPLGAKVVCVVFLGGGCAVGPAEQTVVASKGVEGKSKLG